MFKWTKDNVIDESKKYKTRTEFSKKCSAAYKFARINGMLDDMKWLKKPKPKRSDINDYCVYCYKDEPNKIVYVGLTHCKRKRHYEHKTNINGDSPVFKHFNSLGLNVPEPIYLRDSLFWDEALIEEDYFVKKYLEDGYVLLNKAKTGILSGSLGGNVVKWTIENVIKESKKYATKIEFYRSNITAYRVAFDNNLFDKMPWIKSTKKTNCYWSKEKVIEESKKYKKYCDFLKHSKGAAQAANRGGYISELTWLEKTYLPKNYWDDNKIIEESKKYKTKKEFREKNRPAYRKASEKKLFCFMKFDDDFHWSEEEIMSIADNCISYKDFYTNHLEVYKAAKRKNILNIIKTKFYENKNC